MHTDGHHPNGGHTDPIAGYETRDVALNTLVKWVIGLYIFIGITALGTIPLYFILVPKAEDRTQRTGQNELRPTMRPLPEPVIQPSPIQDMAEFERNQIRTLNGYGRIDAEPGKVHIPIEKAMEQVLAEGFPTQPRSSAPTAPAGIYTAGDTTAAWPARPGSESAAGGEARRMDESPPGPGDIPPPMPGDTGVYHGTPESPAGATR